MSVMELFSIGNTGNTDKKTGVTATDHATQGGNTGNTGNTEKTITETQIDTFNVFCYSPSGLCYEVEARDEEHAAWLKRMNPKSEGKQSC
jgi:hypothetical protein